MEHVIVTRYSISRVQESENASLHVDDGWLRERERLFRRFFVPSVQRLGIRAVLMCSTASAPRVADTFADLSWVRVVEQNEWFGGWSDRSDQILHRLDSDDAVHEDWFSAVENAPPEAEVICTRRFFRLHLCRRRVYRYRRKNPSPLVAFRGGVNPYTHLHEEIDEHYRTHDVDRPYLLQVAHGNNISNHFPRSYRRKATPEELAGFGRIVGLTVSACSTESTD